MIDLNKKYKTRNGNPVVLYEIVDNQLFGRWLKGGIWYSCEWFKETGRLYPSTVTNLDLVEVPEFAIKSSIIHTKTVNYFGINVTVPANIKYIATHSDGFVFGFYHKPETGLVFWKSYDREPVKLMQIEFDGDWCKSLQEV